MAIPLLERKQSRSPIGTFQTSFQLSLFTDYSDEEPLRIPPCATFGYVGIPHVGFYDQDSYELLLPRLILQLPPSQQSLLQILPQDVVDHITKMSLLEHYIIAHDKPSHDEMNIMYHPWLFAEGNDLGCGDNFQESVTVGVYGPKSVFEHATDLPPPLAGAPFGRLEPRLVELHDFRFSPHNCQVQAASNPVEAFQFACVGIHNDRCVVSHHILPASHQGQRSLEDATLEATLISYLNVLMGHPEFTSAVDSIKNQISAL